MPVLEKFCLILNIQARPHCSLLFAPHKGLTRFIKTSKYILHKLQLAGASSTIIEPAALAAAHSFTQGNPRLIDNLMTDDLTIDSQQDKKVIDAEIIHAAVDNQGLYC